MDDDSLTAPELDYAFLAEFARVEGNSLTAVGASFTHVVAMEFPLRPMIFVAGRVRAPEGYGSFPLEIRIGPDAGEGGVSLSMTFDPHAAENPYRGRVGMTFAVGLPVHIDNAGLQRVDISINGLHARVLRFDVEADPPGES